MSKLEELIQELCPDGVKYYNLGAIAELRSGWGFPVKEQGNKIAEMPFYKVADMNNSLIFMGEASNYVTHETAQKLKCNPAPKGTIIFPKVGATIRTDKKRIIVTDSCYDNNIMGVIAKESIVNSKYLYYYLSKVPLITFAKGEGAVPSISKESLSNFKLPIPPLEVQKEIVRLLDDFTAKTAELQAELNKEYEARKKQYKYQKEKLLTQNNGATTYTISELCSVSAGGDAPKNAMSKEITKEYTIPIISNGVRENAIYGYTNKAKIYEPAVTLAARGTIGYAEYRDYPYVPIIRLLSLIPKNTQILDTKYLYHCLVDKEYTLPTTGIPQLTAPMVKKIEISLPKIEIQKEIVRILDKYNIFYRDLQDNLNNELESRQKQYEFYRDKLLTFKELNESEVN